MQSLAMRLYNYNDTYKIQIACFTHNSKSKLAIYSYSPNKEIHMYITTLCYIIKDNKYLMLHRTKKENDINTGKYIGVGGHVENGESPIDCIKREVFEETGLRLKSVNTRGYITFVMGTETEHTILFTSDDFEGELKENCNEGELTWVDIDKVLSLNLWEGDKVFLKLLNEKDDFFSVKLVYDADDNLISAIEE